MRLKFFDINEIELMKGKERKNSKKIYQYLSVKIAAVAAAAVDDEAHYALW